MLLRKGKARLRNSPMSPNRLPNCHPFTNSCDRYAPVTLGKTKLFLASASVLESRSSHPPIMYIRPFRIVHIHRSPIKPYSWRI